MLIICGSAVVEHLTHNPKIEGRILLAPVESS
jgi:hypothetical protein